MRYATNNVLTKTVDLTMFVTREFQPTQEGFMSGAYYATHESTNHVIDKFASICQFERREDAVGWLTAELPALGLDQEFHIQKGRFTGCWIERSARPLRPSIECFPLAELIILAPGTHKGGDVWWITPQAKILTVSVRSKTDVDAASVNEAC